MGEHNVFLFEMQNATIAGLYLAGPLLVMSALVGVMIGFIQAATQIQDQALPQAIKIIVLTMMLSVLAGPLAFPLYNQSKRLFENFHTMVH